MNFNLFWEAHRKFLLTVAGGLAVFLIAYLFATSYRNGAVDAVTRDSRVADRIAADLDDLDRNYDREMRNREVLGKRLESWLGKVALAGENSAVQLPANLDHASTDFRDQQDRIWARFTDQADKINLAYPPAAKSISFDLSSRLTAQEWEDRYRLLEVVGRVLDACVELRMQRVDSIEPQKATVEPVAANDERALVRYPVKFKLQGPYASFVELLRRFQRDHSYLTVELTIIGDPELAAGRVRGELLVSGINLAEPRTTTRTGPQAPAGWGGKKN